MRNIDRRQPLQGVLPSSFGKVCVETESCALDALWDQLADPLDAEFVAASYAVMFNAVMRARRQADSKSEREVVADRQRLAA